jgi:calcium-dependent protein kinase
VKENIRSIYNFERVIGSGNYGTVRLAKHMNNNSKYYAIKSIPKENIERDLDLLESELKIMMEVDHPNIIKFYETYKDK